MRRHSPLQQYNEALLMAKENGLIVLQRPGRWLVYRIMSGCAKNVYVGSRGSVEALRKFVEQASGSRSH